MRFDGKPLCDLCGVEEGSQRHHIYTRYLSMGNVAATEYANYHVVVACLCQECHDAADTDSNRRKLLFFLYWLHGYKEVRKQHLLINNALNTGIGWLLPIPERLTKWHKKSKNRRKRKFLKP